MNDLTSSIAALLAVKPEPTKTVLSPAPSISRPVETLALISTPGFHEMTAGRYHSDPVIQPSLSSSCAKEMLSRSPLHAWFKHPRLGGAKDEDEEETVEKSSKAKETGTLMHRLLLNAGADIVVCPFDSWRKADAKAMCDEIKLAGNIPVLPPALELAQARAATVRKRLDDMGYDYVFRDGLKECVIVWQEKDIWLRAMIDNLIIDEDSRTAEIFDLKTTAKSAHPSACSNLIRSLGYDLSKAFYERAVAAVRPDLNGRIKFRWIFAEVEEPNAVTPVEINGEWATIAYSKCDRAINLWRACMQTDKWPAYTNELVKLEPKPWQLMAESGAESSRDVMEKA